MAMHRGTPTHSLWSGLRQILTHGVITALAVAIAFSLPGIASYILNEWWPEVESNANLLLATEIALASVLALLRNLGKMVKLKFYDDEPFWKLIVLGDYVWVQHCHSGFAVKQQPEFVFALQHREPRHGLFIPFYMVFLNQWNDARHPEYDFSTNELVYRDASGKETGRAVLGVPINGATVPLPSSRAPGAGGESRAALLRRPPEPERTAAL